MRAATLGWVVGVVILLLVLCLAATATSRVLTAGRSGIQAKAEQDSAQLLTLVTRYPFYFGGGAPRRQMGDRLQSERRR